MREDNFRFYFLALLITLFLMIVMIGVSQTNRLNAIEQKQGELIQEVNEFISQPDWEVK